MWRAPGGAPEAGPEGGRRARSPLPTGQGARSRAGKASPAGSPSGRRQQKRPGPVPLTAAPQRRPPRSPGSPARRSPAPTSPRRAAGPLTPAARPLGEPRACQPVPRAYWRARNIASFLPRPPSLQPRRGAPGTRWALYSSPRGAGAARSPRAAIGCNRCLS